ncbi:hypothetical protein ScPMuIL_001832 [Solemya velum]
MDFGSGRRRTNKIKKEIKTTAYPHTLQFYKIPPTETISLQEFEEFAVERLKVLKAVETVGIKHIRSSKDYSDLLEKDIRNTGLRKILKTQKADDDSENEDVYNSRRMDHISHFILRLAYCRSEELRRWFIQQELDLLRYRFQNENKESRDTFLKQNNLNYDPISDEEKNSIFDNLASSGNAGSVKVKTTEYFKVPFTDALDLVKGRKVYLHKGLAYIACDDMVSILLTVYRTYLSHALAVTARVLPHLQEDDRLLPMLCGLSKRYLGQDYTAKKSNIGQVTAEMIDMLSKQSFPPCMQQLHHSLRQNHHMRHWGRQQYGLFLKGIGLSMEEAIKFWRTEFTKLMDGDKWDKQYSYNIRHNYGKEGKRADYTPYSCMKIIMTNHPGPGDFHGCPFRHCDADLLRQKLQTQGIAKADQEQIMNYLKGSHYQLACGSYFTATHSKVMDSGDTAPQISHPNGYFEESQRLHSGLKSQGSSTPKTPHASRQPMSQTTPSRLSQSSQPISQQVPSQVTQLSGIEEMDDDFPADVMDEMMMGVDS